MNKEDTASNIPDNTTDDKTVANPLKSTNTYSLDNYVDIDSDYIVNSTCTDCWQGKVNKISFTLPEKLTFDFLQKHAHGTGFSTFDENLRNSVSAEIKGAALSVFTEHSGYNTRIEADISDQFSLVVDLDRQKIITNRELLGFFNTNLALVNKAVLENITKEVTTNSFLESVYGDTDAKTVTVVEFERSISTYADYLDNRYDLYVLYIEDGDLKINYSTHDVLAELGLGTHMDTGLPSGRSTIAL